MKPRVFISSTYYDLKYVRENLLKFIEEKYEFEAVLFERGNIPYNLERTIGESCYMEVERCNMMILIVGGKYGTVDEVKNEFEAQISFTHNEFKTAIKKKIPVFIFVDKNVFVEYEIYRNNQSIDKYNPVFVDNINIFSFIEELREFPMQSFERIEDIEKYLSEQWTGWFYLYLESLKNQMYDNINIKLNNTLDKVEKLKNVIDVMAKNTLDEEQIDTLRNQEIEIDLKNYAEKISECIFFKDNVSSNADFNVFCVEFVDSFCNEEVLRIFNNININRFAYFENLIISFNKKIDESLNIKTIDFDKLLKNNRGMIKLINTDVNKERLISYLTEEMKILGE